MPLRDDAGHAACVQVWLDGARELDAMQLSGRFEQALDGLWRRALQTLGEITLTAIVDRVLYSASERYPLLSSLKVEGAQLRFEAFRQQDWTQSAAELTDAVRFMLVEFLTVLGNLTAEILTPALHAELCGTASPEDARKTEAQQVPQIGQRHEREDVKS